MKQDISTLYPAMGVPQLIEGLIQKYGSVNAAARACGMPETTMHKLYKGERGNPRLDTLRLLARGYGVSLTEIAAMLDRTEDSLLAEGARAPAAG